MELSFIMLVNSKHAIWDQESMLYRNSKAKANSWKFVSTGMDLAEKDVKCTELQQWKFIFH